jgi:molybdate transport system ATP-binding protein
MRLEVDARVRLASLELEVALAAAAQELVVVVGPNGAGKSTLLRAIAGLVPLDAGRVTLGDQVLEDAARGVWTPPERRPIGLVFQDYALFPHLSALENVAFGLRTRFPRSEARSRARAWLERVGLAAEADARPAALSGGQAQRIALARALAIEPALLLLDEPLAALDASTRTTMRRELRAHLASFPGVRLMVTHDPLEALALADRLVVLEGGRVVQSGPPADVTRHPRSRFVADLMGVNLLRGRSDGGRVALEGGGALVVPDAPAGDVLVVIHPRTVVLHRARPDGTPRNVWQGTVEWTEPQGARVRVRLSGTPALVAEITREAVDELAIRPGSSLWVSVKATEIAAYGA